jgi:hypothetical protein
LTFRFFVESKFTVASRHSKHNSGNGVKEKYSDFVSVIFRVELVAVAFCTYSVNVCVYVQEEASLAAKQAVVRTVAPVADLRAGKVANPPADMGPHFLLTAQVSV